MNEPHKLDYARPQTRAGHSPFGIASVCMALAVILFSAGVLVWGDPFHSWATEKPIRIGMVASLLGVVLAARAMSDPNRKRLFGLLGLWLNIFNFAAVAILLPSI